MERRRTRFALRDTLAQIATNKRHIACGRYRIGDSGVDVKQVIRSDGSRVAHFARLQLCGCVWTCPVCGPRIRQARADDVRVALHAWYGTGWTRRPERAPDPDQVPLPMELGPRVPLAPRHSTGHGPGSVLFLTLTLPHDYGEELGALLGVVRAAFARLVSGYAWQKDKRDFGLRHYVRAHDVTFGKNGPHPHLHVLLFAERGLTPAEVFELRARFFRRWVQAVGAHDRRVPTWEHGVNLEAARCPKDLAFYLAQVSGDERLARPDLELARGDLKTSRHAGHRTPWQVLADYRAHRRPSDLAIWRQWEAATRGVHSIRWSKGLRAAVGLDAELTDEQIVMLETGGELVYTITPARWSLVRFRAGALAAVLEACESAGALGIKRLLNELARGRLLDTVSEAEYYSGCLSMNAPPNPMVEYATTAPDSPFCTEDETPYPAHHPSRIGKRGGILAPRMRTRELYAPVFRVALDGGPGGDRAPLDVA